MTELKNTAQMNRPIRMAKAGEETLEIERTGVNREFRVFDDSGRVFQVNYKIDWLGKRHGDCTCDTGRFGGICKHIMCVASLNICQLDHDYFKQENFVIV